MGRSLNLKMFKVFIVTSLLLTANVVYAQFKVIGYVPNWNDLLSSVKAVDMTRITHVNVSFINPDASGNLGPATNLTAAADYCHANNVKILASIAGASASEQPLLGYYQTLTNDANRNTFVDKLVAFAVDNHLDGIDVDLEGNAVDANYEKFVVKLKTELIKKNLLMSAAVGTWYGNKISNNALAQFDFVNIMSYDATGTWAPGNPGQHSPYSMAVNDLAYWTGTKGLAKEKVTIGLPFYGYYFKQVDNKSVAGALTFAEIVSAFSGSENVDQWSHPNIGTVYYNGIPTIKSKTQLALTDAGGVMFWQSEQDAKGELSLLKAIDDVIRGASTNVKPVVEILTPASGGQIEQGDSLFITANATDSDGSIFKVEYYMNGVKIADLFNAPYNLGLVASDSGTFKVVARTLDNLSAVSTDTITFRIKPIQGQIAYGKTPWTIPGKVEAENYNVGNNGVAYSDLTIGNTGGVYRAGNVDLEICTDLGGGYSVGYVQAGEWLNYSVSVPDSNSYDVQVRVASNANVAGVFHLELDGTNITGPVSVPKTGGWQSWVTKTVRKVSIDKGDYVLKLVFDSGELNVNYMNFKVYDPTTSVGDVILKTQSNIVIAPNPVTSESFVRITGKVNSLASVAVYDVLGNQLSFRELILQDGENLLTLGATYTSGVYYCKVVTSEQTKTISFVVK